MYTTSVLAFETFALQGMASPMLQGCRCDGYTEQQTRLEGIVPGGLAAGGLSKRACYIAMCLMRCYADSFTCLLQ